MLYTQVNHLGTKVGTGITVAGSHPSLISFFLMTTNKKIHQPDTSYPTVRGSQTQLNGYYAKMDIYQKQSLMLRLLRPIV